MCSEMRARSPQPYRPEDLSQSQSENNKVSGVTQQKLRSFAPPELLRWGRWIVSTIQTGGIAHDRKQSHLPFFYLVAHL